MSGRFVRLGETDRATVQLLIDGDAIEALEGDTLMVAILSARGHLRHSEFGGERRAGFCLMGACQDCWVRTADGERIRACSETATEGMSILTDALDATWPNRD